ncbi:MAG: hypothetical protein H0V19_02455, partial [Euzebyales bacterium]|nr:hypothetical protein [Euzebyales bacterium]
MTRIPLDGDGWRCKGYVGEEWRTRRAYAPGTRDVHGWHQATVPGSVVADLVRAGDVPDPRVDRNSRHCEWVAERTWVYRRDVSLTQPLDGRRVVLHLEGVDHAAEVFCNGERVGAHEGMFTPAAFDVSARVTRGDNVVSVVVAPAPDSEPQVGRTDRVGNGKSRMTYGWDFCPRLIHLGLWDRAWIDVVDGVRITDVHARPRLAAGLAQAAVAWEAAVEIHRRGALTVEAAVLRGGEVVAVAEHTGVPPGGVSSLRGSLTVDHPALWWPNGHGEQPLYELRVRARLQGGGDDVRAVRFGIRHVELVANASAPPSARPYTFVVNGVKVYAQGWNWVPMDIHHGVEDPDRLGHLIDLAARAHVNLLRVWGGGLVEKEAFYDLCDRHGIMVWQEFPLSSSGISSQPSRDPAYVARMAADAERIVPRRRNHPSLVLWCGGNELHDAEHLPLGDGEPVIAALRDIVGRLDPDRAWLPTSPAGPHQTGSPPAATDRDPDDQHDVHGPWEHQGLSGQRTVFNRATSLLHSEFGVEGLTNLATLEAFVSPEHRWPADRSNPHWVHRGDWWINTPMVGRAFGGGIDDLETLVRASQLLQAEGLRYAVEANRRRQWRNSGSIPWQFNEPFPNGFCTSAVDYRGRPKAAYHGVAAAYRPVHPSASFATLAWHGHDDFAAELWVSSSREHLEAARLEAALVDVGGRRHHDESWDLTVPAGSSRRAAAVRWPLRPLGSDVFWLDLRLRDQDGA